MPLRVLHVQDHTIPEMSGYAFRSRYLVLAERSLGVDAEVVSSARHRKFSGLEETVDGLRFHRTPWPASGLDRLQLRIPFWRERILTAALERRIVEVAQRFRPDVLHAHSPMFNGMAALAAAARLSLPVVYQIRAFWEDDAVDKGKFREGSFVYRQVRRLETRVCERAAGVVTICEGLRRDLAERGIAASKLLVVPNGVDVERFRPIPKDHRLEAELGLAGKEVVGFVGSFFHYEGLPLLMEAVAKLVPSRPALRVLLVGGGEDEERTRERARTLGIEDRVVFTGRVPHDRVDAYYSIPDVQIYPRLSKRITELVTPLKPLEALAMEKAVIGSDVLGIRELFEDCGVGRTFRAGSADDLARAIAEWLDTPPAAREAERKAGREAVSRRRTWAQAAARMLPLYAALSGKPLPERQAVVPGVP